MIQKVIKNKESINFTVMFETDNIKNEVEKSAFGVCTYLGEKFRISTSKVRMYFIYATCATFGSTVIVYLFLAFWVNIRKYIRRGNPTIWE